MKKDQLEHLSAALLEEYVELRLKGEAPAREVLLQRCPEREREALAEAMDGLEIVLDYHCADYVPDALLDKTLAGMAELQSRRKMIQRLNNELPAVLLSRSGDLVADLAQWFVTIGASNPTMRRVGLVPTTLNRGPITGARSRQASLYLEEANLKILESTVEQRVEEVLNRAGISEPPIDLSRIAQSLYLTVREVSLDPLDGCLVTNGLVGIVLINRNVTDARRRRFTLGHECAHAVLHATQLTHTDRETELDNFDAGTEMQANVFCSHLLMPTSFLPANFGSTELTFSEAERVCDVFEVSLLASLWRHVRASNWECALVVIKSGTVQWSTKSPHFEEYIHRKPHPGTLAGQYHADETWPLNGTAEVPIQWWLDATEDDARIVREQSRKVSAEHIYTLLTIIFDD